jgi:hypothetical protein
MRQSQGLVVALATGGDQKEEQMRSPTIAAVLAVSAALAGMGTASPASAACSCRYEGDPGYRTPKWSSNCNTTVSPGKFGPLRMGRTTVAEAKRLNYLVSNPFCGGRVYGLNAGALWEKKGGKVVSWFAGLRKRQTQTTRGLHPRDSWSKAKQLYPGLKYTRYVPSIYGGPGQNVYSTRRTNGWLDVYATRGHTRIDYFSVRATSVAQPVPWIIDGC